MSQKLYFYDSSKIEHIIDDVRIISFLYSFQMDRILNKELRGENNQNEIEKLITILTTKECKYYIYHDEFIQDDKLTYCVAFAKFMHKVNLYIDDTNLTISNFKKVIIPTFYKTLLNMSTYFKILHDIICFRVIILKKGERIKPDKGFISVSINPVTALWIFGYKQILSMQINGYDDQKDIYFYKIKIDRGSNCIPITSLGTIDYEEQEILFTNKFTLKIEKVERMTSFNYNRLKSKLNKQEKVDFDQFLLMNSQNLFNVEAKLVPI